MYSVQCGCHSCTGISYIFTDIVQCTYDCRFTGACTLILLKGLVSERHLHKELQDGDEEQHLKWAVSASYPPLGAPHNAVNILSERGSGWPGRKNEITTWRDRG